MHSQNRGKDGDQLPSLTLNQKRRSSLRSLQEIQQRRSAGGDYQSNRSRQLPEGLQSQTSQLLASIDRQPGKYPSLLNMSQDQSERRIVVDRAKGRSIVEGNINMYPNVEGSDGQSAAGFEERSQMISEGAIKISPSEGHRRGAHSGGMTPKSRSSQKVPPILQQSAERINHMSQTASGVRQSFKLQILAPLDTSISNLAMTQRNYNQGSSKQIGPLFVGQGQAASGQLNLHMQIEEPVGSARTSRVKSLRGQNQRALKHQQNQERNKASTFQFANAPPKEVSEFLQRIIQEPLIMGQQKPMDLDSTEALDSFLDIVYIMVDEKVCDFSEAFQQKLHLATGVRTEVCEDILQFFAQLQTRNNLLINAVQFFNEYLTKISELEGDKEEREKQVNKLVQDKEELFLTKYDLERKLSEMSAALKLAQTKEQDAVTQMKTLQKKFDSKVSECESLMFRLRHMEDITQMLEPPGSSNSLTNVQLIQESPENERVATIDSQSENQNARPSLVLASGQKHHSLIAGDFDKLKTLEVANKRLESELGLMKEALKKQQEVYFKDNIDHFGRIQELYNKVQTENKQLRTTNKKVEAKLEAKERLIGHLEGKVTQVMVEKEEIIVTLKSDIVLLKASINENEKKFETKIAIENAKFQKEFQSSFSSQEKKLKDDKDKLTREKVDLNTKTNQLQNELEQLASDFSKYRTDITKKDIEQEQSITELQQKLKQSGQLNETQTRQLQERIETFNNQNLVLQKQNAILELKLKLVKDSVETLYKQKMFIVENIERSCQDLAKQSALVEANMMSENGNKEYLISVKKAVKISQTMVDMGLSAITNVAQIVAFLKIDEVRNLVIGQESVLGTKGQKNDPNSKEMQQEDIEKLNLLFQQEDLSDGRKVLELKKESINKAEPATSLKVQKYTQGSSAMMSGMDSEEHYYNNCPVELSSILTKVLAETLVISGGVENESAIPIELMKLVQLGSRKADPAIENEIYQNYLAESKNIIEERFMQLYEENKQLRAQVDKISSSHRSVKQDAQLKSNDENNLGSSTSGFRLKNNTKLSSTEQQNQLQEVSNTLTRQYAEKSVKRDPSASGLRLMDESQNKRRMSSIDNSRLTSAHRSPMISLIRNQEVAVLEQQVEQLKFQNQEQKMKHKDLSLQLAQKIVLLEEQLDEKRQGQEQELNELEQIQRDELERTKFGIQQREAELLQHNMEFKVRAEKAEEEIMFRKSEETRLHKRIKDIELSSSDYRLLMSVKEKELKNYQENVQSYVNLKVSQRNVFGITLEISKDNQSMITEAMLKYYLNKCLQIDKGKFRFISTEELTFQIEKQSRYLKDQYETPDEQVTVVRVMIEIIDDQQHVDRYFKMFKTQIRDGKSILYDLQPLYLSLNLGQCGIHSKDQSFMRDYHLIRKRGVIMRDEDYVVSILRHKYDPLKFKIIASSADQGEEYILDLQSRDLFELTEGKNQMLEVNEPSELIETMFENLSITLNQETGVKTLSCEHKVYFNSYFVGNHVHIQDNRTALGQLLSSDGNIMKTQPSQDSLAFRNTSFRNTQILAHVSSIGNKVIKDFKEQLQKEVECQTDSENHSMSSLLSLPMLKQNVHSGQTEEMFVTTYQGYQRVGRQFEVKIKIDEGQKSGTVIFTFEEIRTKDKCQVCMLETHLRDRYVIHSECVKFKISEEEEHMLILTFEKFQQDGLLIKMHDMKSAVSEEIFIVKKSNGQYAKLTRSAGIEAVLSNGKEHEQLRNLLFDLTFTLSVPSQQILYSSLAQEQQMLNIDQEGRQLAPLNYDLPDVKRVDNVHENQKDLFIQGMLDKAKFSMPALAKHQMDIFALPSGVLLQKHERGELLYRNIFTIRCCFEADRESEHESLISFYVKKDGLMTVEVFIHKSDHKMSIASQVSILELFGSEYQTLSFSQKTEILNQMMERLYVMTHDGQFHLKVENEAIPMSSLMHHRKLQKKRNQESTQVIEQKPSEPKLDIKQNQNSTGISDEEESQLKLHEILANREQMLSHEKCMTVKTYAQINDVLYDYRGYFIMKVEKDRNTVPVSPSRKKTQTSKAKFERQVSLSNNIDDIIDFDYLLIEANDARGTIFNVLLNIKKLTNILLSNPYEVQTNWQIVQNKDKDRLLEYLKTLTKIDDVMKVMTIDTFQPSKDLIVQMCSNEIGGVYLRRDDDVQRLDIEEEVLEKKLLMNQEVDMSEFSYDVKLFQIFNRHQQRRALSYCLEIFSLNEPDLIFRYNYALHEQSSHVHSPVHIGYDIINLIDNPKSRVKHSEEQARKKEFQSLIENYISNRLILVAHEQIFPHQITFCLYESSSRLHWSYIFNPVQADPEYWEVMSKTELGGRWNIDIGQLSILDQGTAERFLAVMMNEILDSSNQIKVIQSDLREDNWQDLGDLEALNYDLLRNRQIGEDLEINLSKIGIDSLKIEIRNKVYTPDHFPLLTKQESTKKSDSQIAPMPQISEENVNSVKFLVNASQRNKFICKLIKIKDQSQTRLLVLTCDLKDSEIVVKVIELSSKSTNMSGENMKSMIHKVLYQYTFKEKKVTASQPQQFFTIERQHLEEAITEVCTSGQNGATTTQLIEKASQFYDILSSKEQKGASLNIFQDSLSVSQRRLLAASSNPIASKSTNQFITLFRKQFFDESHERLIIVSVLVNCQFSRKKGHGPLQLALLEVDKFKLIVHEPETNRKMDFELMVDQCFLEEELLGGVDLRNISHLKRMAKVLVEERAIIKRISKDYPSQQQLELTVADMNSSKGNTVYTIEINLSNISFINANGGTSRSETSLGQNQYNTIDGDGNSQNKGGSKSNKNSIDYAASTSLKNAGHIPEDEGGDEFEAMETAIIAKNTRVSSGQTNLQGGSGSLSKQQSMKQVPPEILTPQQSVIEEEGSQEDNEDSPSAMNRASQGDMRIPGFENANQESPDGVRKNRYQLPEDEQRKDSEVDEDVDERSQSSQQELLYERQLNEVFVLQILSVTRKDPYSVFEVRQQNINTGQTMMHTWLDQELIENVIESMGLPQSAGEQHMPELFDALADYVISNIIRKK